MQSQTVFPVVALLGSLDLWVDFEHIAAFWPEAGRWDIWNRLFDARERKLNTAPSSALEVMALGSDLGAVRIHRNGTKLPYPNAYLFGSAASFEDALRGTGMIYVRLEDALCLPLKLQKMPVFQVDTQLPLSVASANGPTDIPPGE